MSEVLFYHLERRSLDLVLPELTSKTLERGWRGVVLCESAERADALDTLLWTYDEQSFLPHAKEGEGDVARQPVLITTEPGNPNGANVLFIVGGTPPPPWDGALVNGLARIVVLFDGRDAVALSDARGAWKQARAAGHDVTYWKESARGKWEKQS